MTLIVYVSFRTVIGNKKEIDTQITIFSSLFIQAVLGGNAESMKALLNIYEPYMNDSTNFPKFQVKSCIRVKV